MIEVLGPQDTNEFEAATTLKNRIVASWPHVADDTDSNIYLIASVKCHGQLPRDIDILVLGEFLSPPSYQQFLPVETAQGRPFHGVNNVLVNGLCFLIELKDHSPDAVRFIGAEGVRTVEVLYKEGWKNVTEQAFKGQFSVRSVFFNAQITPVPFVSNLIWLRNVDESDVGNIGNIIGANFPWELVLNKIAISNPPKFFQNGWHLTVVPDDSKIMSRAIEHFTKPLEPTNLDRRRLELITEKKLDDLISRLMGQIDDRAIMLQGRAGTGKTITLLRLGYRLAVESGASVLVLTYNRALVSDIRRMLTLTGLGDGVAERRVVIDTVHNLMHSLITAIGISIDENSFLEKYDDYKNEALELLIEAGNEDDYANLVESTLPWDYILVDEAQDWPQNELDLLLKVRGHRGLVIADGVSQLVRQPFPADWMAAIPRNNRVILPLDKCLRMKSNIARFVTSLGVELGVQLRWSLEESIPGGKVIIVDGNYEDQKDLHDSLTEKISSDGQKPLDMLFCVPPRMVHEDSDGNRTSTLGTTLESWGHDIWDGVSSDIRRGYPTSVAQLRIVQYDSCRGLEGWTSVNLGLDEFYDYKMAEFQMHSEGNLDNKLEGETADRAHFHAVRWLMIPLTRAIDTLVISIEREHSPLRTALIDACNKHRDFVTWIGK